MRLLKYLYILLLVVFCAACRQTQPQRPSQRNGVSAQSEDTTLLALMTVTQRLAMEADKDVLQYIQKTDTNFAQLEIGTWYKRIYRSEEEEEIKEGESFHLQLSVRSLKQELLLNSVQTHTLGREELPPAVSFILPESFRGDSIVLVAPWYCAYGALGNEYVKPYQNVIIELKIQ